MSDLSFPITTKLKGVSFYKKAVDQTYYKSKIGLIREPSNKYDSNAICVTSNGRQVGYVPKELAAGLAPYMDQGAALRAKFVQKLISTKKENAYVGILIKIER